MARHVADLRLAYGILSGRDPRDPVSVDAPLEGASAPKRAALVTDIPGGTLADSARAAVLEAGRALENAGWEVTEAHPPELERVSEIWAYVMSMEDRTFKLGSGTTSVCGRYVKSLWEAPWRAANRAPKS